MTRPRPRAAATKPTKAIVAGVGAFASSVGGFAANGLTAGELVIAASAGLAVGCATYATENKLKD